MKKIHDFSYNITSDASFMDEQNAMTFELKSQIESLYHLALSGKQSGIKKFHRLIKKYPRNPQLKNYLSILYQKMGNTDKANEVTKWILAEHPNYLFGKLNLAFKYIADENYDKVVEILGEKLDLQAMYPHRDTFHVSEVTGYNKAAVLYYLGINNIKEAEKRIAIIKDLAPDSIDVEEVEKYFFLDKIKKAAVKFNKEDERSITIQVKPPTKRKANNQPPKFTHPEIQFLYTHTIETFNDKLEEIVNLPRKTLIKDIETVLTDVIDRKAFFYDKYEELDESTGNFFVNHALLLLGDLKAKDSLPIVLEVLQQDEEFIDFFIGDFITEYVWQTLYQMIQDKLEVCEDFMRLPGVYTFSKNAVADAVFQIALHRPDRKEEVIEWYASLFEFYIKTDVDKNIIDSNLIGMLVGNMVDLKAKELLPLIKKLYMRHKVDEYICGTYTAVAIDIQSKEKHSHYREIKTIKEIYHNVHTTWAKNIEEEESEKIMNNYQNDEPLIKEKKVGRNEPCPCGSGKKYKKCCLKLKR